MYKKLSEIKIGREVIIRAFENEDIFLKLMEMGCVPGEKITVDKIAPFRDPISVTVAGYSLSLRLDEAEHILVEEEKIVATDNTEAQKNIEIIKVNL
jgi:ferrous iron transport protein A